MSKKDFIALADELRIDYKAGRIDAEVLDSLCTFMSKQNSRFNRERWLAYLVGECGPNGGPVKTKVQMDRRTSK